MGHTLALPREPRNGRAAGSLCRTAANGRWAAMDALSDLLRVLRFTGGVFLDATFRTPWCVYSQVTREDCTPDTPSASVAAFHYVLDGHVEISIGDAPPRACRGGDLIVVVRNDVHRFGSDLSLPPMHVDSILREASPSW